MELLRALGPCVHDTKGELFPYHEGLSTSLPQWAIKVPTWRSWEKRGGSSLLELRAQPRPLRVSDAVSLQHQHVPELIKLKRLPP